jgi:hypothetical protein
MMILSIAAGLLRVVREHVVPRAEETGIMVLRLGAVTVPPMPLRGPRPVRLLQQPPQLLRRAFAPTNASTIPWTMSRSTPLLSFWTRSSIPRNLQRVPLMGRPSLRHGCQSSFAAWGVRHSGCSSCHKGRPEHVTDSDAHPPARLGSAFILFALNVFLTSPQFKLSPNKLRCHILAYPSQPTPGI